MMYVQSYLVTQMAQDPSYAAAGASNATFSIDELHD